MWIKILLTYQGNARGTADQTDLGGHSKYQERSMACRVRGKL